MAVVVAVAVAVDDTVALGAERPTSPSGGPKLVSGSPPQAAGLAPATTIMPSRTQ